jgi:hypothetical protein
MLINSKISSKNELIVCWIEISIYYLFNT